MSKLRPTLTDGKLGTPCPTNGTAYMLVLAAVKRQRGLVHGKLEQHGEYCAIGSYFHDHKGTALPSALIDEIAMVNDAVPHFTERSRKAYVMKWLKWKLSTFGMKV